VTFHRLHGVRNLHIVDVNIFSAPAEASEAGLLDSLATAVLAVDSSLRIHYLNIAAEQLLGISQRRAIGQTLTRALNIPDSLFSRIRQALESGQPFTDRQVSVEPHGQDAHLVDLSLTPYRSEDGLNALILEISMLDRPLRIARDEAMLAQQEHAASVVKGLAHEIKNPLGGLRGAAQLLARQLPDKELTEYTSIIIREADRLHNLIDRMLGPTSRTRRDIVNLHEVLEHVRKIIIAGAPDGVVVRFDYDPSIPECKTDRDRLVQVLLNIAGNALQALQGSGRITFRSRVVNGFTIAGTRYPLVACVEIKDNGPGISESLIDQIFFPMVKGDDGGSGLGLSIAQSIMNQLGGLVLIPLEIA